MQQLYSHHQQQRPQHSHSFKNIGTVRGACSGLWELTNQSRLGLKATGTKMVHSDVGWIEVMQQWIVWEK